MAQTAIAHKYARALFDSAREAGCMDEVGADVAGLAELEAGDPAFLRFLVSPEVLTERKMEFIKDVFGPRLQDVVTNFLRLLVDKGRVNYLPEMCEEFVRMYEEHQGQLRAQVMTAIPLSADQEARLKSELDRITGRDIQLEKKVDPSVLGGVVVHLGNKIVDRSLRRGLRQLQEKLLRVEVN
jgi:F-type H+-transporting ATPase subunit delta